MLPKDFNRQIWLLSAVINSQYQAELPFSPSLASLAGSWKSQTNGQCLHGKSRFLLLGQGICEVPMQWILEDPGLSGAAQSTLMVSLYNTKDGCNGPVSTEFCWRSWEASAEVYLPRSYLGWIGKEESGKCSIQHRRKERPGVWVRTVSCARQETKIPQIQKSAAKEVDNQVFL